MSNDSHRLRPHATPDDGTTRLLHRADAWFAVASRSVNRLGGYVILPAMTTVMMIEVIARYVFNSPFLWTFELASHLLLLVFLSGIVECTRTDGHIRMDLVYLNLPGTLRRMVRVVYYVCAIGIFALVIKYAASEIPYLYRLPVETEYLRLPVWIFYAAIVAVAAMVILLFVMRLIEIALLIEDDSHQRHG